MSHFLYFTSEEMASTTTLSFFEPTSPFVTYATSATRGVMMNLLRVTAMNCRVTTSEAIRIYFDGAILTEKTLGFKQLLSIYLCTCCDEYLTIHQQILEKKLQKSDLSEKNMDHYVYCTIEKIMSQSDGYRHLNCLFDGLMKFCIFQFERVFALISHEGIMLGSSASNRDGNFSVAELNILRYVLQSNLDEINATSERLYVNGGENKNCRLKCEENNSCELKIEDVKQRLKQQAEIIQQEADTSERS